MTPPACSPLHKLAQPVLQAPEPLQSHTTPHTNTHCPCVYLSLSGHGSSVHRSGIRADLREVPLQPRHSLRGEGGGEVSGR